MLRINRKTLYVLIILLVATVLVISLAVILILQNIKNDDSQSASLKVTSITVNNVNAELNNNDYLVYIPQCKNININCRYNDGASCKWYDKSNNELSDITSLLIDGNDIELRYVLSKGSINAFGTLFVKNIIPETEGLSLSINNATPNINGNEILFELSPKTTSINSVDIKVSEFFNYKIYSNEEKTAELDISEEFPLLPIYYLDVFNVNKTQSYKNYTIRLTVKGSDKAEISYITVNGERAVFKQDGYSVSVEKTSYLNIEAIADDKQSTVEIYRNNQIINDISNIFIDNKTSDHIFNIHITAENGNIKNYKLLVALNYDANNSIESIKVNDTSCHFDDDALSVLLDRTDRLSIFIKTTSLFARAKVYNDYDLQDEINDITNIDTYDCGILLQYYVCVTAENGNSKKYILNIHFIASRECQLNNLSVNSQPTTFNNNATEIDILGEDEINICLSNIAISKYASFEVYTDESFESQITDIEAVKITPENPRIYIRVVAENGENTITYSIYFNIISTDNYLNSVTVNDTEYVISSENTIINIESADKINISHIGYGDRAQVNVFYDSLQTEPIGDLTDLRYENYQADIFVRVVAESSDIRVYHLTFIIKDAPEIEFIVSSVTLTDWQNSISLKDLIKVTGNAYTENQFDLVVSWNGIRQYTDIIKVENAKQIYTLNIKIESPYFESYEFTKQIEVFPYSLTPVNAKIINETVELLSQTDTVSVIDLIELNGGSYILGKHYYIAIYKDTTTEIITESDHLLTLTLGTYYVRICSVGDHFDDFYVGEMKVIHKELNPPEIISENYYEFTSDPDAILPLQSLFSISSNGNDILLITIYVNGIESSEIALNEGQYGINVVLLYDKGTIEKTFMIDIGLVSDNTAAEIKINGTTATFIDGSCEISLAYNESLNIIATTASNKAQITLTVNGSQATFGNIELADGCNEIIITVTAESGAKSVYIINANKKQRNLPEIITVDKTVKLTDNQLFISIADNFSVKENDYTIESISIIYDGNEIYGNILPVSNENKTYEITVKVVGEFGIVEKSFTVGVIRYSTVKIEFKAQTLTNSIDRIFTANDFIDSVTFIGYDKPYNYDVYFEGVLWTDKTLADGQYTVTVRAWHGGLLLSEASAVFTVTSSHEENPINVKPITSDILIDECNKELNFNDIFELDYGNYDRNRLDIYYVIDNTQSYRLNVTAGYNAFYVVIVDIPTQIELFAKSFTVNCIYSPTAQHIFKWLKINGYTVEIYDNTIAFVSHGTLSDIELEYATNDGFSIIGLSSKYNINHGINYIGYTAIIDGQNVPCVLEVYNVREITDYINTARYGAYVAENNIISATSEIEFNIAKFSLDLSDNHVKTQTSYKQISFDAYDITVIGKYNAIDIGRVVIRIFIGKEKPILGNVLLRISEESIVSYSINDFSINIICVSDNTALYPEIILIDDKHELEYAITNLHIGTNSSELTVIDNETMEQYVYEINITLFPENIISCVEYDGIPLLSNNNVYIVNTEVVVAENIHYMFDERIYLPLICKSKPADYNGNIIGYDYTVIYNFAEIYRFSVAAYNDNIAVSVICDKTELVQNGNDKFTMRIDVDKAVQEGSLIKSFNIKPLYPYTTVSGANVEKTTYGYIATVDLGEIQKLDLGTTFVSIPFIAHALNASFEYSIVIELSVTQTDESSAPLIIIVNGREKIIFTDQELERPYVMSGRMLNADIFDNELVLTLGGTEAYKFYESNIEKDVLVLPPAFNGYLQFEVIVHDEPKQIIIPCNYVDDKGNNIDTGIKINGEQFIILENADVVEIVYGGTEYDDVFIADKKLCLPFGTTEVAAEFFGYLAADDSFVFTDGSVGRIGTLSIQNDKLIILIDDYGKIVPYVIIEIEFSEGDL